jgi:hypothetical protein
MVAIERRQFTANLYLQQSAPDGRAGLYLGPVNFVIVDSSS